MNCLTPGFPVHHQLPELTQSSVQRARCPVSQWCHPTNSHPLIPYHPLLLLPSVFPSIRVFSKESPLHIRWPKYWSFSFSISPFNEYFSLNYQYISILDSQLSSLGTMSVSFFWPCLLRDLSSLTRDQTHAPCNRSVESNHWTAREFPRNNVCLVHHSLPTI